jgi:ADP-ribose pyrophosphatase
MNNINFTTKDCEVLKREVIHAGIFCYVTYQLRHRLFKGGWTPVLNRELVERTSAAGILPYDPILDRIVLISQFRPGAMKAEVPWLVEIVAGVIDTQEKPEQVAIREAEEEAGCQVLELYPIADYFVSPGGSNEYIHVYCGRIDSTAIEGIHGLESEHEDIYAFSLPAEEAFELLQQGKIKTSPAIIALQWLQINRDFLRNLWLKKS